jgi:predicted RNA-binding protein YlqC (UPF0109 family)
MQPVREYLIAIVSPLLKHPDELTVDQTIDEMGVLLSIKVHKYDMGTIVGRNGETAKAIRQLVRIVGLIGKQRVSIRVNEPDGSTYKRKDSKYE